jgi:hypothetical protein
MAEGRKNALDVAGLWLMSEELLWLLVWRGFLRLVVGFGYRLGTATEAFRGYMLYNGWEGAGAGC